MQPFHLSPQAGSATGMQMPPQDPPKIRVVVRKRPINKKVGCVQTCSQQQDCK